MPGDDARSGIGNDSQAALRLDADLPGFIGEAMTPEQDVTGGFEQWSGPIYEYLVIVFGHPPEAEEVVQETFLQLYKSLQAGQTIHNTRGWLFRVAHNLAINQRKHEKFYDPLDDAAWDAIARALPDRAPDPEQRLLRHEKFARIHAAMKKLSMQERQCLQLRAEGFRYREIGEVLGINTKTVYEYLRRAVQKLKKEQGHG